MFKLAAEIVSQVKSSVRLFSTGGFGGVSVFWWGKILRQHADGLPPNFYPEFRLKYAEPFGFISKYMPFSPWSL